MITALFAAPLTRAQHLTLVLLIAAQVALVLVLLIAPGPICDWTASQRIPGAEALPLIARNFSAVPLGYWRDLGKASVVVAWTSREHAAHSTASFRAILCNCSNRSACSLVHRQTPCADAVSPALR